MQMIKGYQMLNYKEKDEINKIIYNLLDNDYENVENYLKPFYNRTVKKEIKKGTNYEKYINSFIVKASRNNKMFNIYVKPIINQSYSEYKKNVRLISNKYPVLLDNYIYKNIDEVNFMNKIEMELVETYIKRKLDINSKLKNKDIKIIIKFLIEHYSFILNLKTKVHTIGLLENINMEKFKLPLVIEKTKKYLKVYGICKSDFFYDGIITINTDHFKIQKSLNPFLTSKPLFDLLITCFHEIQHAVQNKKAKIKKGEPITLYSYKKNQEHILIELDKEYYVQNHQNFFVEADANIVGCEMALKVIEKYSKSRYDEIKDYGLDYIDNKNAELHTYDDAKFRSYINELIKECPIYLKEYPFLLLEYNKDGSRKTFNELIITKSNNLAEYDLKQYLIIKKILETDFDQLKNELRCLEISDILELNNMVTDYQNSICDLRVKLNEFKKPKRKINKKLMKLLKEESKLLKTEFLIRDMMKEFKKERQK